MTGRDPSAAETAVSGRSRSTSYDAFISYSHALDGKLAPAVQRGLHQLARPWYQMRALRVFRDTTSLAANPDLWSAIETAMASSRVFVLLASPQAAASRWVGREVEFWQRERERERFLIAVTDGTVVWDPAAGDFDWSRTTALPGLLRGYFDAEPMWVDLSWARGADELSMRHSGFRNAIAALAAPMHGRPKDELDSEDVRQHRVFSLVRRVVVSAMTLLLVLAAVSGVVALQQRNTAQRQALIATSQALAGRAIVLADTEPKLAVQLALYAYQLSPTFEARSAMAMLVDANPHVHGHLLGGARRVEGERGATAPATNRVALSGDGRILAHYSDHGDFGGGVRLYNADSNSEIGAIPRQRGMSPRSSDMVLDHAGRRLVLFDYDQVELWDVGPRVRLRTMSVGVELASVTVSPDGHWIAAARMGREGDPGVVVWDADSGAAIGVWDTNNGNLAITFSSDSRKLFVIDPRDRVRRTFDVANATWAQPESLPSIPANAFVFPDGSGDRIAVLAGEELQVWDLRESRRLAARPAHTAAIGVAISADGRLVVVGTRQVDAYDGGLNHVATVARYRHDVISVAVSADGRRIATTAEDGSLTLSTPYEQNHQVTLRSEHHVAINRAGTAALLTRPGGADLWDIAAHSKRGELPITLPSGATFDITSDGERVVALADGVLSLWDAAGGKSIRQAAVAPNENVAWSVQFLADDRHVIVGTGSRGGTESVVVDTDTFTVGQQVGGTLTFTTSSDRRTIAALTQKGVRESVVDIWRWSEDDRLAAVRSITTQQGSTFSALAINSDSSSLALADGDGRLHVVGIDGDKQTTVLDGRLARPSTGVAFSDDGKILVQDGNWGGQPSLLLWDVESEELMARWNLPPSELATSGLRTLVAGPESTVVTVGPDNEITQWHISIEYWRDVLCRIAGDKLTDQDRQRYLANFDVKPPCQGR